jgi:hypothetical protein
MYDLKILDAGPLPPDHEETSSKSLRLQSCHRLADDGKAFLEVTDPDRYEDVHLFLSAKSLRGLATHAILLADFIEGRSNNGKD